MTERLRLEAEFRDRGVSAGLRRISGDLKEVRRTPGMVQAHEWMEKFTERSKEFVSEGGGVGGVLKGIGLGGLVASTSLGELVASFKELGERAADLKEISRQTGLTVNEINQLQRAGEKLHLNPNQMSAGLEHWSSQMFDFRRHMGELWGELAQQAPDFANKLSFEKPEQQIEDIIAWLGHIKDPELQKRWSELFFGSGEMARLLPNGGRDFAAALKEAQEHTQAITGDFLKKQEAFHESILEFEHSWTDFETAVAPLVFDQLKKGMEDFKEVFEDIKTVYDWFQEAKNDPAKAAKTVGDALDKAFNDKAKEVGDRWRENGSTSPGASGFGEDGNALRRNDEAQPQPHRPFDGRSNAENNAPRHDDEPISEGKRRPEREWNGDGNALRRGDETPPPSRSRGGGWFGGLFGGRVEKSAFTSFDGDGAGAGGSFGFAVVIREAVKSGTMAAYRELLQQSEIDGAGASAGGGGGFQNASWAGEGIAGGATGPSGRNGSLRKGAGFFSSPFNPRGFGVPTRGKWWTPDRQLHAVDRLMKEAGLSAHGAEGLVSRWANVEAGAGPTSYNPKSGASGIAQWLGVRRHGFTADYDSQLSKTIEELNGSESAAGRALRAARNAREGAIGASRFERAEHYNPRTGVDDWTAKSLAGAGRVHDEVAGARRRQMNLPDAAQKAGAGRLSVEHSGGAEITIKGLPQGTNTQSKTSGMITAVNLQRGPTMISATT